MTFSGPLEALTLTGVKAHWGGKTASLIVIITNTSIIRGNNINVVIKTIKLIIVLVKRFMAYS